MKAFRLLLAGAVLLAASPLPAQTLVVGYSDSDGEPFYVETQGQQLGGFIPDVSRALAKKLGVAVEIRGFSRNRIEEALADGDLDVIPLENQKWAANPRRFTWSEPWFRERTLVVFLRQDRKDIGSLSDLRGLRVGTILGYFYPGLEQSFEKQQVVREDATTFDQNLAKLRAGRLDAIIGSEVIVDWLVSPTDPQLKVGSWVEEVDEVSLAVSPKASIAASKILKALKDLVTQGTIQNLWSAYRR